ncbi:MAG TPA: efflux RND transporter periplasmic adaptor subunit [Chitinophagaceae bacterium]|nr:efflux RND transporter periplasmic adaptor subunit [Chitinophagaceae bacterium]
MKLLPLSLLVFLYSCASQPAQMNAGPSPASVVTINTETTTTQNDYTASIEGKVNVEIRPQVEGYLEKIFVDEGAYVQAGQALFKINDAPFREQINSAKASLQSAEAAMLNAQLEIDKLAPLVQNKVVSDVQLKTAKATFKAAQANAAQASAQVSAAQINLGYTLIKAPVSGYIGRLPKKQGALISRSDPEALTNLSDVHEVYAYFSLSENDFVQFKAQYPGKTLEEKLKSLPPVGLLLSDNTLYPVAGKIDMIDGQFNKSTGAITLRAVFDNKEGLIRSGNTGKIRLSQQHQDAILVPQAATLEIQDKVFVFTVDADNKVAKQAVVVSGKNGSNYLVSEGVKAGDRIVYSGLDHLQEGAVIKPETIKETAKLSMNK